MITGHGMALILISFLRMKLLRCTSLRAASPSLRGGALSSGRSELR
jgi:hypothetical protein